MIALDEEYSSRFEEAREVIEKGDFFRIFSHYDADGVSSGLILSETLRRLNKKFHISFLHHADLDIINHSDSETLILSDLGSEILGNLKGKKVLFVDHHMLTDSEGKETINLNPRKYGYDGTKEACSSTVAFLLSLALDKGNSDLFPAFLAGVIGDKQNIGGFNGINAKIVENTKNLYPSSKNLTLAGKSVSESLYLSIDPYFDGLSGSLEGSRFFLQELRIDPDSPITSLRTDEKEKLVDSLVSRLLRQNVAKEGFESLVSDIFVFKEFGLTGNQLFEYFDASGRNGKMGLPTSWFMGNDDAIEEMDNLSTGYRKEALGQIETARDSLREMENIQVVQVDIPYLAGTVGSSIMVYLAVKSKPVISLWKNRETKISGRGTRDLVGKGLDLSTAIGEASSFCGGHGGGHDIAAGGEIPFDKAEMFLKKLDEVVGNQLAAEKKSSPS